MCPINESPHRGQLFIADLSPVQGSEQGGVRPVVILQNDLANAFSPIITIAPLTTKQKKVSQPSHVMVPKGNWLPEDSMALLEQVRGIDKSRLMAYLGSLPHEIMEQLERALCIHLNLLNRWERYDQKTLVTLCPKCLNGLMDHPDINVRRADHRQKEKSICGLCCKEVGYDYWIYKRQRRKLY